MIFYVMGFSLPESYEKLMGARGRLAWGDMGDAGLSVESPFV